MAIRFPCANGHTLTAKEEMSGQTVRCPYCHETTLVPDLTSNDDADEDSDRPKSRSNKARRGPPVRKLSRAAKLQRVRLGLGFHYARLIIFLVSPLFLVFAMVVGAGAGVSRETAVLGAAALLVVGGLLLLALLATPVLGIIGSILCVWVPKKRIQTLALIAFGLDVAGFGVGLVQLALTVARVLNEPLIAFLVQFMQMGLSVAAWVVFMLYLRQLANYLEEWGHADEAKSLILFGAVLVLGPPVMLAGVAVLIAALASPETRRIAGGFLGCFALLGGFAWVIIIIKFMFRQLELLSHLRAALAKKAAEE